MTDVTQTAEGILAAGSGPPDGPGVDSPTEGDEPQPPGARGWQTDLDDGGVMNRTPSARVAEGRETMVNAMLIRAMLRTVR